MPIGTGSNDLHGDHILVATMLLGIVPCRQLNVADPPRSASLVA
jgi:hypothetical protein